MADLVGIATAAFQGVAALGTVAAAVGSLRAASQARDSVLLAEMTRHIDRLAAIADTVDSLIAQSGTTGSQARRELARELAVVEDALPLCRQCAAAPAGPVTGEAGDALVTEIGAALRAARDARDAYISQHAGSADATRRSAAWLMEAGRAGEERQGARLG